MGALFQSHQKQKKIISELIVRVVKPLLLGFIFIICTGWWPLHFTVLSWYQEVVAWGAQLILKLSQIKHPESWAGFWTDDACASQWLGLLSVLFNWWLDTNFYGFIRRLLLFQIRAAKRWYFNRIQRKHAWYIVSVELFWQDFSSWRSYHPVDLLIALVYYYTSFLHLRVFQVRGAALWIDSMILRV